MTAGFDTVPEHELIRATLREFFAARYSLERIRELDAQRNVPRELWVELAALGLTSLPVPQEYGGAGADLVTTAVAIEEVGRAWASAASDVVLLTMTARLFSELASDEQKQLILPGVAAGTTWVAFGMTELSGGTDLLGLQTRAALEGDEWVIRGQKVFTSRADEAQFIVVLARTEPPDEQHKARATG